ncbi:MAG: FAD-dependent oxidoreductase, partial [Planctomycetales bacterium]|nr:FAD-dependent oxidoreductase [Planctomycetales bacterium]
MSTSRPPEVPQSVVIVGGGVIGVACAHYLRRAGAAVTIIEQGEFGQGASHANCGYVSPSHALPLAMPGAVGKTLRMMWKKNSPIYVKPRVDFRLWGWLWQFARRCNEADMLAAGAARHALLSSSRRLFDELIVDESLDCEYETRGCLFVYEDEHKLDVFTKIDRLQTDCFGVAARRLGRDELLAMEPAIKPHVAGAWYYEIDAHLRPDRLLTSWRAALEKMGVEIIEHTKVDGFEVNGRRVAAAQTATGKLRADAFVV